jgi:hypothetical protein
MLEGMKQNKKDKRAKNMLLFSYASGIPGSVDVDTQQIIHQLAGVLVTDDGIPIFLRKNSNQGFVDRIKKKIAARKKEAV